MDRDEFRAAIKTLGFSQEGIAELVGASARTGQKWALGEARVPGCVDLLLRLLIERPELREVIESMARPALRKRAVHVKRRPARKRR